MNINYYNAATIHGAQHCARSFKYSVAFHPHNSLRGSYPDILMFGVNNLGLFIKLPYGEAGART